MTCRRFRRCERRDHLLHRIHIMNPTNRSVDIDGSTMSVLDVGSGPAIVLAGSFLWDASMWAPQIAALSDRYRVIVPELWGHGRSGAMPAGTRTMKDLARQHLTLLDALEVGSCAVVGLSVGGMWGAETALMAPARVSSLVLMGTSLAAEPNETRDAYFGMLAAIEQHGTVPAPVQMAAMSLFFSRHRSRSGNRSCRKALQQSFRPGILNGFGTASSLWAGSSSAGGMHCTNLPGYPWRRWSRPGRTTRLVRKPRVVPWRLG
jgi:pimeloyl-ACP methyl ester carboxylesterase